MDLRGLLTGPVKVRSLLMILLLVGSVTGVNALLTSPEREPETVPAEDTGEVVSGGRSGTIFWGFYQENDIIFAYPNWMTIREAALGGNNTVMKGALHGTVNGTGQYTETGVGYPEEEIIVIWKPSGYFDSIDEAMEYAFQAMEIGNVSFKGAWESSVPFNHNIHYRRYSCLREGRNERSGVAFIWNCTDSERVFIVHVIHPGDDFQWRGINFSYEVFFEYVFQCHIGRKPIRPKTEEEKRSEKIWQWIWRISLIPVFSLLCIGFTLTYKMQGFPNIAHVHYSIIGSMVSWTLCSLFGMNPYDTWPITALIGGSLAVLLYFVVFQPIAVGARHWNRPVVLTFAFLTIAYMIMSLVGMFNYYTRNVLGIYSTGFGIGDPIFIDFGGFLFSGIMIVGTCIFIILILGLRYFLYHTNFGTGILATADDERLASTLGIDAHKVHIVSWFISGSLSAFAGSMMSMKMLVDVYTADELLVRVMAGSVLGGLDSVFGSIIGGAFMALGPEALGDLMFQIFGIAADPWRGLYPMVFLVTIMMIAPNGITRLISDLTESVRSLRDRLKRRHPKILQYI